MSSCRLGRQKMLPCNVEGQFANNSFCQRVWSTCLQILTVHTVGHLGNDLCCSEHTIHKACSKHSITECFNCVKHALLSCHTWNGFTFLSCPLPLERESNWTCFRLIMSNSLMPKTTRKQMHHSLVQGFSTFFKAHLWVLKHFRGPPAQINEKTKQERKTGCDQTGEK